MLNKRHTFLTITFVGVFFIIVGLFGVDYLKKQIQVQMKQRLPPTNGSDSAAQWERSNQPGKMYLHLFNITNAKELKEGTATQVQVKQVGPFVYEMIPKLIIEKWSDDNQTVQYRKTLKYIFNATESKYPLDTMITTINVPLVSTVTAAMERQKNSIFISTFKMTLNHYIRKYGETLFINRTADELLFKGYQVPMIEDLLTAASWVMNVQTLPNGTFGLFYGKNNTDGGEFNVYTGYNSLWRTGQVYSWNKLSNNTCFETEECNRITGGDGVRYSPFLDIKSNTSVHLYANQFYRNLRLDLIGEDKIKRIPTLKYKLADQNFARNKENSCFCVETGKTIGNQSICSFDGIQDISTCERSVPLVMSQPHFLGASSDLKSVYVGLNASEHEHRAFMQIDQLTGIVVAGQKQAQINIHVQKYEGVNEFDKISPTILPVVWVKQVIVIGDERAVTYYESIHQRVVYLFIIGCAVLIFGSIMFLIGAIGFIVVLIRSKSNEQTDETAMRPIKKKNKPNTRYDQSDVKSREEIKNL